MNSHPAQNSTPRCDHSPVRHAYYSARDVAERIGTPPPTPEQAAVIEAPLESAVVIAGAGSGKTTVVAQRVIYLVANGMVDAQAVLGLTFTRKAVGELSRRIREGLARFRSALRSEAAATAREGNRTLPADARPGLEGLDVPSVQTYNAYAAGLVREYGLAIGIEPDTVLLDDASAALLASRVVDAAAPDDVPPGRPRSTIVTSVLELSGQIDEHLRTPDEVEEHLDASLQALLNPDYVESLVAALKRKRDGGVGKERAAQLGALLEATAGAPPSLWPAQLRADMTQLIVEADISKQVTALCAKKRLLGLVREFRRLKRTEHAMQFSDQVAFAYQVMEADPDALEIERSRWQIVLLDEYQDTSDSQSRLLSLMFADLPVMAVGDPRQSIYAWRGASAGTIGMFSQDFLPSTGRVPQTLQLTTSWRNPQHVLSIANRIARPLASDDGAELTPRPGSDTGHVEFSVTPGALDADYGTDQLRNLAQWISTQPGTRAVLCRKRALFAPVAHALTEAGMDVIMAGRSGGLDDPYVADVFAALNVIVDPGAGNHLMRLLTGNVCALGAADIAALDRLRGARQRRLERRLGEDAAAAAEPLSLAECIDDLVTLRRSETLRADIVDSRLSAGALERVSRLAGSLQRLRSAQTSVVGLTREVIRELGIDAEIEALPPAVATEHRAAIDTFLSTITGFIAADPAVRLADLLVWLELAEESGALDVAEAELPDGNDPDDRSVVVMTVHAAKGLEFDAVAIPNLVIGDLPSKPRDKQAWLGLGRLPYPLRGDAAHQPFFDLTRSVFATGKELEDWIKNELGPQLEDHQLAEERRLAYVAVTRSKGQLWLGAAAFSHRAKRDEWSPFLLEAIEELGTAIELPDDTVEKEEREGLSVQWPVAAPAAELELRTTLLQRLARTPQVELGAIDDATTAPLAKRAEQLLAESRAARSDVVLPERLSTTSIVALHRNREDFLRDLLRPMPQGPALAASLGTAFHAWVEKRYGQAALAGLEPEDEGRRLPKALTDRFEQLCATFEASEFARIEPAAVELPFELDLGGTHIPGKIDAVFDREGDLEVVDWKTGRVPDAQQLAAMTVQLSVYALAVSRMERFTGRPVRAALYFVADDEVVRPERLLSEDELVAIIDRGASTD